MNYTVSPVHNYFREQVAGMSTLSRVVIGYRVVIRRNDYVVHMLPIFQLEATAHRVAQLTIKKLSVSKPVEKNGSEIPCKPDCYYYTNSCFRKDCVNGNNAV